MPLRFGFAGTFVEVIFNMPGSTNSPTPFLDTEHAVGIVVNEFASGAADLDGVAVGVIAACKLSLTPLFPRKRPLMRGTRDDGEEE